MSITNFGSTPVPLPAGELLLRSDAAGAELSGHATAWLRV
jgi:hypothetical protein